jgi:uncharacterized damage-inducible protein DinB
MEVSMFRRVEDFLKTWERERAGTLQILERLDDSSLSRAVAAESRTLGRIAWHVTTSLGEMMGRTGLNIAGAAQDAPVPTSAAAIARAYQAASKAVADQVGSAWTDATLDVQDDMYGQRWPRGTTLFVLVSHQTHHRGQMTVLMRQAGLVVPGVCGQAREEWTAFGMQPPAV